MPHETNAEYVELPKLIGISTDNVEIPKTQAEIFRSMGVGDKIAIPAEKRQNFYINAIRAFRKAEFSTRKIDGNVYLVRTA